MYIGCSHRQGDCEGVHQSFVAVYEEALECNSWEGPECDFDCHPRFGLTQLVGEGGLCSIRDAPP